MPHVINYTEEIEEHGFCDQCPALDTGEKYIHEVEGEKRLRIVTSVYLDRYVWERVAQWRIQIVEYFEEEYVLSTLAGTPVFIVNEMLGVLTCDKELVHGGLVIPSKIGSHRVSGIAPFGFYGCQNLTEVVFHPMVVIVYECAFAQSGLKGMTFNHELPVFLHASAIDNCDALPKFNRFFDRPFSGKYLFHVGEQFQKDEAELRRLHFIR